MKLLLVLLSIVVLTNSQHPDDLKCDFRICGADLLNFEHFGISSIFRKIEIGSFCIKNCTPPIVHEFFQSIIYGVMRRIPQQCDGENCADKNRFVALAKCVKDRAWPLLQCSKRLIDLAQIGLVDNTNMEKRNTTCSIVVETTQCIEENLQICGDRPFTLVKEIFGDVVKLGINVYCHPAYRDEFFVLPSSTYPPFQERMKHFTDIPPKPGKHPYPQYVKGYRPSTSSMNFQNSWVLFAIFLANTFVMQHL